MGNKPSELARQIDSRYVCTGCALRHLDENTSQWVGRPRADVSKAISQLRNRGHELEALLQTLPEVPPGRDTKAWVNWEARTRRALGTGLSCSNCGVDRLASYTDHWKDELVTQADIDAARSDMNSYLRLMKRAKKVLKRYTKAGDALPVDVTECVQRWQVAEGLLHKHSDYAYLKHLLTRCADVPALPADVRATVAQWVPGADAADAISANIPFVKRVVYLGDREDDDWEARLQDVVHEATTIHLHLTRPHVAKYAALRRVCKRIVVILGGDMPYQTQDALWDALPDNVDWFHLVFLPDPMATGNVSPLFTKALGNLCRRVTQMRIESRASLNAMTVGMGTWMDDLNQHGVGRMRTLTLDITPDTLDAMIARQTIPGVSDLRCQLFHSNQPMQDRMRNFWLQVMQNERIQNLTLKPSVGAFSYHYMPIQQPLQRESAKKTVTLDLTWAFYSIEGNVHLLRSLLPMGKKFHLVLQLDTITDGNQLVTTLQAICATLRGITEEQTLVGVPQVIELSVETSASRREEGRRATYQIIIDTLEHYCRSVTDASAVLHMPAWWVDQLNPRTNSLIIRPIADKYIRWGGA